MSTFIQNIEGTFDVATQINFSAENKVYSKQQIILECNTNNGPVIINLPSIGQLEGFQNLKIIVDDANGNAGTNNITVNANGVELINDVSSQDITIDNGTAFFLVAGRAKWLGLGSGSSGGGSGLIIKGILNVNGTIQGQPFVKDVPFPAANAGDAYRIVITSPGQDKGMVGGVTGGLVADGIQVEDSDLVYAINNNAGGDFPTVGADWTSISGEALQLWENGDPEAPGSIKQINLTSPNVSAGLSSLVTGSGNTLDGLLLNVEGNIGGADNTMSATNRIESSFIYGRDNSLTDTTNQSSSVGIFGEGNIVDDSQFDFVSGSGNALTLTSQNTVSGESNTITGAGGNGATGNVIGGVSNTISDSAEEASVNAISGASNTIDSASQNAVSGASNTITGAANNGATGNNVSGSSNTLTDVGDSVNYNLVSGSSHVIASASQNVVGGTGNGISGDTGNGAVDNAVFGGGNTVTATDDGASRNILSGNGNTLDSANDNLLIGGENSIIGFGNNTVMANMVGGQGNSISDDPSNNAMNNVVGGASNALIGADSNSVAGSGNTLTGGESGPADNNILSGVSNTIDQGTESIVTGTSNTLTGPNSSTAISGVSNVVGFGSDSSHVEGVANVISSGGGNGVGSHVEGTENEVVPHPVGGAPTLFSRIWGTFARAIYGGTTFFSGGSNGLGKGDSQTFEWDFGGDEAGGTTPVLIGGSLGGAITDSMPADTAWLIRLNGIVANKVGNVGDGGEFEIRASVVFTGGVCTVISTVVSTFTAGSGAVSILTLTTATGFHIEIGGGVFDGKGTINQVGFNAYA